jgi:hypothetical protein
MGESNEALQPQTSEHRSLVLVLSVFATALAALAVAGGSAWWRCGRGSDCSSELAFAIIAIAPACLIGVLMVFLLRVKMRSRGIRTALLAIGVGVASLPLAAFLLRDVWLLPAFAALLVATVVLVLWEEASEPDTVALGETPPWPTVEERPPPARSRPAVGRALPRGRRAAATALAVMDEMAALNHEILWLCDRLSSPGPARALPAHRRTLSR